jgi:Xaa-Pro aminopeptidase
MTQPLFASSLAPLSVPPFDAALYRRRRERLAAQMRAAGGGVAIIPTAPQAMRNADADYPYRHDSAFYYLSGFVEPEALLVIDARTDTPSCTLFCRVKDVERETWEGMRYGPDAAREQFGFEAAHPFDGIDAQMPALLANAGCVFYAFGAAAAFDASVLGWINRVRAQRRAGVGAPARLSDVRVLLDEMRVIKDAQELAVMRRAAQISAHAHLRTMRACRPGMREYELEAELLYEFRRQGAQAPAYGSIVAAGANACILHYPAGNTSVRDGDLILIDAACELDGYASDITRTFPASGKFSGPQRELYDIVLAAQNAAIAATRAGARFDEPHDAAVRVLAQGMRDTGLLDGDQHGSVDDIIASGAYSRFYMHRTGHWLGMDVHDCGNYRELDPHAPGAGSPEQTPPPARVLQPNMVLTIEPGLYVRAADDIPKRYWDIGIRIEDDAIVTASGCELMTREVPVDADEIEAWMRHD